MIPGAPRYRYCHECGAEFEAWAVICNDCEVELCEAEPARALPGVTANGRAHDVALVDVGGLDEDQRAVFRMLLTGSGIRHEDHTDAVLVSAAHRDKGEALLAELTAHRIAIDHGADAASLPDIDVGPLDGPVGYRLASRFDRWATPTRAMEPGRHRPRSSLAVRAGCLHGAQRSTPRLPRQTRWYRDWLIQLYFGGRVRMAWP